MVHYYLQKGFTHGYILNLNKTEKDFYLASMILAEENEIEKMKAMKG